MAPPLLPITRLVQCSGCDAHVKRGEVVCPHCGGLVDSRPGLGMLVGAAAVAGVLSSCITAEPAYGVVVATEPSTATGTDTDTDSASGSTGPTDTGAETGTGTATESMGTMNAESGESDYGVPTTDQTAGTETGTETDGGTGTTGTTGTDTGSSTTTDGTDSAGEADYGVASTL